MNNPSISVFKGGEYSKTNQEVGIVEYLEMVRDGRWQDAVFGVRTGKREKKYMPSVTVSGLFDQRRRMDNLKVHSGFLALDLDDQDNEDLLSKREQLENDPHCYALHTSLRGKGLVFYVKIDSARHLDCFLALEQYLANTYSVVLDPSGKDVSRLRFVSFDPHLHLNQRAKKWTKSLPKKEVEEKKELGSIAFHEDDIGHIMEQISARRINIAEDYHDWLHCSFALASQFGEGGRSYFHLVSSMSSKYDERKADRQYNVALKRNQEGISIGTFFFLCKDAGIDIMTEETKTAISVYRQRVKMEPHRTRKEAGEATAEYLQTMEGFSKEKAEALVEQLDRIPDAEIKGKKVKDKLAELENFIRQQPLRRNFITDRIEFENKPVDDFKINSIYRQSMHAVDFGMNKNKVWDVINSDIVPTYNPFLEFFESHGHLKPKGRIKEVLKCFEYEEPENFKKIGKDYLEMFLTRWMLSIISSMHGTHSILVLVLVGGQGTGKTKFFRGLLPDELKGYYAESKLDHGKDDEILMCHKLVIMDDEFGGKSKIEAKKFKEISSRETFTLRRPYGRTTSEYKRYAVLCGTSNDYEVLNDITGNRRLIPVNLINFDYERFEAIDKVQLFAELYHIWKKTGDKWILEKEHIDLLNEATVVNEQKSHEEELLEKYFTPASPTNPGHQWMTNTDILIKISDVARKNIRIIQKSLGLALKKLGFQKVRRKNGETVGTFYCVICELEDRAPTENQTEGYDKKDPDNQNFIDFD